MKKKLFLSFLFIFCISMLSYGVDGWIRINQLGYLPNGSKKAVFISESPLQLKQFSIHDALTNEEIDVLTNITDKGQFQSFQSTYILDFSSFKQQGAFYIKAGLVYSPTIYINKNVYLGSADFLLNYIRQQRNTSPASYPTIETGLEESKPATPAKTPTTAPTKPTTGASGSALTPKPIKPLPRPTKKADEVNPESIKPKIVDVTGGWMDGEANEQSGAIIASTIYQLLFAYQTTPTAFCDKYNANGNVGANKIPDILDEAKWGLDWLLKAYPAKNTLYFQVNTNDSSKINQAWLATGKPAGKPLNHSTGVASIAGKYAAAFGLGAEVFSTINQQFADTLKAKAIDAYLFGKSLPGVCQPVKSKIPVLREEENWADDMELAASHLYRMTYDGNYLRDAAAYGRMEPVSPWMCSDTARHYQWYPFINIGHYMLSNVENPRLQKEFSMNLQNGLQRMSQYAFSNPFNIGIPFIQNSNNLAVALATQCHLYRTLSNDTTYREMETALLDWMLGRNPWGISMVNRLPANGTTANALFNTDKIHPASGALTSGPVSKKTYKTFKDITLTSTDALDRFQADRAVYHNDANDYVTNAPTLDGTASFSYLLSQKQQEGVPGKTADQNVYSSGCITRTDISKKQITLIFEAHDYADGYKSISKTLKKLNVKASFFFTGDFYRTRRFKSVVKDLIENKQYVGANSDRNPVYCSFRNKDSLLITKSAFFDDLRKNYEEMAKFGIRKDETPFFLPPYETYNDSISQWCREAGLYLICNTPGLLTTSDNSIPEMREKYYSSNEIYNKIMQVEKNQGLNGYILMFHLGADKRRQDKFYPKLQTLLIDLKKAGYEFTDLYTATDVVDYYKADPNKKQKRKNK
jgi:peptidoglycan/xylan/chitin deacetylase (PgdA/CDA1 family)